MGLNVLKWAYDLGVKQERNRIAMALTNETIRVDNARDVLIAQLTNKSAPPAIKFDLAVLDRVSHIINRLYESDDQWVPGNSIMFPEGDKKR